MEITNIIYIHGVGGVHRESYITWLEKELKHLNLNVIIPSLGGYRDGITYLSWKTEFEKLCKNYINKNTIVIAQSMGTQFFVKYMAETNGEVAAYISCAAPYGARNIKPQEDMEKLKLMGKAAKTFIPTAKEYNRFKNLTFNKYSFYSNGDIFFELDNLEKYYKAIGATPHFIKNKGHFNFSAGVHDFPELLNLVKEIINIK